MKLEIIKAKNGENTAKINNFFLHSSYSPSKEAETFCKNIKVSFTPEIIFISEPALSFTAPFLKNRFPTSKLCAIRYSNLFNEFNSQWDYVIDYSSFTSNFVNQILSQFSELSISLSLFLQWIPSSKVFPELDLKLWEDIKALISQANTLLVTREHFEEKWIINTINFLKFSKKMYNINRNNNFPVLITASGPSLKNVLPLIKENQNKFLIICLSSAFNILYKNNIKPDFVLSTDGGFWAGEHLKPLKNFNAKLAITTESFVKKQFLLTNDTIPLMYDDGISYEILKKLGLSFFPAIRNGTVSGTALYIALSITSNNIYFAGLDLASQKGYQHTQPNIIENSRLSKTNKTNSLEKGSVASELNIYSLKIYENWFKNVQIPQNKVFRIIEEDTRKNELGLIKDINSQSFSYIISRFQSINKDIFFEYNYFENNKIKNNLCKILKELSDKTEWNKQIFPLTYSASMRNPENHIFMDKLNIKNTRLLKKIEKILYE